MAVIARFTGTSTSPNWSEQNYFAHDSGGVSGGSMEVGIDFITDDETDSFHATFRCGRQASELLNAVLPTDGTNVHVILETVEED